VTAIPKTRASWIEIAGLTLVMAAVLRYWLWYFDRGANLLDEGSTVAQALRVLHGELIYRDFFTYVAPGSYYTVAALFAVFGTKLIVMRWAVLITGLGIAWLTLSIGRRLMPWPFAGAAALLATVWGWFLVTPNYYSLEAVLLAMLTLAFYLRYSDRGDTRWLVWAGVMAGLTILVKQNTGAYTVIAIVVANRQWRPMTKFLLAAAAPVLIAVAVLVIAGAGPYLYESWFYYPFIKYRTEFRLPYGHLPEPQIHAGWMRAVAFLPIGVYAISLASVFVLKDRERSTVLTLTLFGLCLLAQAWPRADVAHILFALPPAFLLFMFLLSRPWPAAGVVMLIPAVALLWVGYQRTEWEYSNYGVRVKTARALGTRAGGDDVQRIDQVTGYIQDHTAPGEPIFVVPWAAGFYFLADRPNPTRIDFMLFADPELNECVLSRLDEAQPKYVIYGYVWDVDGRRFSEYARSIDNYIRTRYDVAATVNGYEIWKRRVTAAPPQQWPGACQPRRFRWR
jgi:hypothetical protein